MSPHLFLPRVPWRRVLAVLAVSLLLHALLLALLRGELRAPDFSQVSNDPPPLLTTLVTEPAPVEAPKKPRARPPRRPPPAVVEPAPVETPPAQVAPAPLPAEPVPPSDLPQETPPVPELAETAADPLPQDESTAQAEAETNLALLMAAKGNTQSVDIPSRALYNYKVTYSGLVGMTGRMQIGWIFNADTREYRMHSLAEGLNLTLLRQSSRGRLQTWGLAPERYVERRLRRSPVAANLNWEDRKATFSSREYERPLEEGAQDRLSFLFQLTLLAQQLPERFVPGRSVVLRVAGSTDVVTYRMQVVGTEQIRLPDGPVDAVHLDRPKLADSPDSDRRVEVWLAPSRRWQVVKIRYTERRGDVLEGVLDGTAQGDLELPPELMAN